MMNGVAQTVPPVLNNARSFGRRRLLLQRFLQFLKEFRF